MTPDMLEGLVLQIQDPWDLQKAFADLDEKQRAKLSSPAQKIHSQLYKGKANDSASDQLKRHLADRKGDTWKHWNSRENRNAVLALFAVGPLSVAKKRDVHVWYDEHPAFERIIEDRRPEWLDDWISHELAQDFTSLRFPLLRSWIKRGICRKPEVDGYYRMFASHLMRTGFHGREENVPPLSRQLLDDPDLLQDVEGIFRVETIAFNTNGWLQKGAAKDYESWPQALIKLSAAGHLDRERLLCLALEGLRLDIKQNQLSGFHRFYGQMEPAADELRRHQSDYIELLCHPVGHVAKFAIDMLAKVEKLGALDTEPVLRELPVVFAGEGKGNAIAALKLIDRITARGKRPDTKALSALCDALRHGHADVQAKAIELLAAKQGHLDEGQLSLVRDLENFVAASNRSKLSALLAGVRSSSSGKPGSNSLEVNAANAPRSEQPQMLSYVPLAGGAGFGQALFDEDRLEPIVSTDELIATILHAVEVVDAPDEIERIIDGISRLANDRPANFSERVAPLLHRLKNGRTGSNGLGACFIGVGLAVIDLVYSWAVGTLYRTGDDKYSQYSSKADGFVPVIAHLRAITDRVARQESRLVLAAPTHRGGWIDPLIWAERLHALQHVRGIEESIDLRLSMLRLAPDNRAQALERVRRLGSPLARIAEFALGGEVVPTKADRRNYAGWITAARCRDPSRDWQSEFAALDLIDQWPGSIRPAEHHWRSSHKAGQFQNLRWKTPDITLSVTSSGNEIGEQSPGGLLSRFVRSIGVRIPTDWREIPTAALSRRAESKHYWSGDLNTTWVAQWLAYVWPQHPVGALMKGAAKLAQRMDENSSNWTPGFGFLHALFQKNRPWGEAGHLVLCLGLVGKDADVKGLAVDAMIEGIEGRLFDPSMFASVLTRLSEGEWVKYNRLGESLLQVAQVDSSHAHAVSLAIQSWLPQFDLGQKNAFHILEVLVEAQAMTGQPLAVAALEALRRTSGSGKAAKLAKQLESSVKSEA